MPNNNRYAQDWNLYSKTWEAQYGTTYTHLGDEWNDDQTPVRQLDNFYFTAYADRWITPEMTVLEVGPGGGKWTVRLAPRVKRLVVLDVAEEMLKRTQARCEALGLTNVEYVLANGQDFRPMADASVDFFFSYDVFVHIALEDSWVYAQEMARILKPGGRGACHYAVNTTPEAWARIEQNNEWYRFGRHTVGQYYYHSPEALRQMFTQCGLALVETNQSAWHCVCIFEKSANVIVPKLEVVLRQLISEAANDSQHRAQLIAELRALPDELKRVLDPILNELQDEKDFYQRLPRAAQIRRLWRGL